MMSFKILFAFLVLAVAVSAQVVDLQTLDPFTTLTFPPAFSTSGNATPANPEVGTAVGVAADIVGGEHDIAVVVQESDAGLTLSSRVGNGIFSVASSEFLAGFALLQFDGTDGVTQLDGPTPNGLQSFDMTLGGLGSAFRFSITSDLATEYDIILYDSSNNQATFSLAIPAGGASTTFVDYTVQFAEFVGVNMASIGAMEVIVELEFEGNVDTQLEPIFITGVEATPTPTPLPTVEPTVLPVASPNGFTWYTFDDDDNGRSPCGDEPDRRSYFLSDNNIVYYYFFGFDFTTQEVSSSDAATVVLSSAAALAGLVAAVL